ncbi:uncharacterized protein PITG_11552 [Phytophthora infestans T30-4]|uniref:Glycoside hydrolase n=1 Tax=Phytophthora infestans (strain T30-4) TaxID=403677 RepID=D0NI06_PHYIT|nr:uncharacterized protein PITG_11552 [Phytophthora infestans T30-4]EEY59091.1 conserved hypothetical protein [Phytophthora infestans T30-4]|eukprot:XP_002901105.1 conserved hypothetical protein [Phytophthora infestans T30-4]
MTVQLDIDIRFIEVDTHFFLNDLTAATFTFGNYGTYNWGPEVLGCFPSISGIKVSEQPLTKDSMDEIKAYLNAHPTEIVVVYLETGADIQQSDKFDAIDTMFTDTFGDLLVPVMALDALAKGMWAGGGLNESNGGLHTVCTTCAWPRSS